jgi:hypothetical protein
MGDAIVSFLISAIQKTQTEDEINVEQVNLAYLPDVSLDNSNMNDAFEGLLSTSLLHMFPS